MESFLARVKIEDNGCWVWTGAKNSQGYGILGLAGSFWLAHRAAWFMHTGIKPEQCVCHHCDNPPCVNPDHLFLGTQGDNTRDMERKGRSYHKSGELHGRAKLTWDDVNKIRQMHRDGVATRAISRAFPIVSRSVITGIVKNRIWLPSHASGSELAE